MFWKNIIQIKGKSQLFYFYSQYSFIGCLIFHNYITFSKMVGFKLNIYYIFIINFLEMEKLN